jgi:membrane associated rhomboid family serine protease
MTEPLDLAAENRRLRRAVLLCVAFVVLLWWVKMVEALAGIDLTPLGVYPRQLGGLLGIPVAPLIHGSVGHLFANSLPLILLGTALLYGYPKSAPVVLPVLFLGTGLGVWLFGRESYHIGASGITFGMMFFVFVIGALRWDRRAIALSCAVFFLYGGMVWGVFPGEPQVSHEAHASGAVLGAVLAVLLRRMDPLPVEKRYSWEGEEAEVPEEEDWAGR